MKFVQFRAAFAKVLLAVSYCSLLLQWLWVSVILLPPLIKNGTFDILSTPSQPNPVIQPEPITASPAIWLIVGIVTLVILIVTVVVLIRIPRVVAQAGERVVHQAADAVIPVLTHHKPLSQKKKRLLSRRVTLALQLVTVALPTIVSFFLPSFEDITPTIIVTIACLLAAISTIGFVASWFVEPPKKSTSRTQSHASRV